MPQLMKGGKFVFGFSRVGADGGVRFPPQAVLEYAIASEGSVIVFTGSKTTGGFCVSRPGLMLPSLLGCIPQALPELIDPNAPEWVWQKYKGRKYCRARIEPEGIIRLPESARTLLGIGIGDRLMAIRASDIAFVMGHHGPLLEHADAYEGVIEEFLC